MSHACLLPGSALWIAGRPALFNQKKRKIWSQTFCSPRMNDNFSGHRRVGKLEAPDLLSCLCKLEGRSGALHLIPLGSAQ